MFGFQYYTPTKVVFGKGTEEKTAELIREFGGRKVLIHYGGAMGSARLLNEADMLAIFRASC